MRLSKNILIAGEAGQGLVTVGMLLAKALVRSGYEVFVTQGYESRIRGGHNTFAVRTGLGPIRAGIRDVDLLIALNQESISLHREELTENALVLVDAEHEDQGATRDADQEAKKDRALRVPFAELAPQKVFHNIVALGVAARLLGLPENVITDLVRETFAKKETDVVEKNVNVLQAATAWAAEHSATFQPLPEPPKPAKRMVLNGNQAVALGALAAGTRFCAFYPMTPATGVALTLGAAAKDFGLVVEQAEDEIAAINMAIGASYAGAPALVPTSGGGFALMTEGISLAGMTETPLVLVLGQRPGPATGLPTRTEQGDLNLALYAGHGEFPRAILTPGSIEECFRLTHTAVDMAERSQGPVIVMTDQYLADTIQAIPPFDLEMLAEPSRPARTCDEPHAYKRYAFTEDGVSPRLLPGTGEHLVVLDSDEHTEDGHITEDLAIRKRMVEKRLGKERKLREAALAPTYIGDEQSDLLLICWGSTLGPADEAAEILRKEGCNVGLLHFRQVWPLRPEQFLERLRQARETVCVEGNATGQFAGLLRKDVGFSVSRSILRYDGLPFTAADILRELNIETGRAQESHEAMER
ncbi:2-oxoacid:acceptor oxidoreductase subunit alpha [Desulfonatronum sp. SC1]|uniref:2-oxoacid:acceptor oxidoreductase subunit alpha n=1 Tax=Desulfonatronum sp. SC1 TaxID=2109626 RepID=UPI000D3200DC|nr:2-oxoacid:acceptor oxidoreductase subunit alpha [Desulfonatronum sp. SC1]PTN38023.1 2-oxoacid:acceptor oxidoreductase subunit alpha [Desulfonatronum sp. SC1]